MFLEESDTKQTTFASAHDSLPACRAAWPPGDRDPAAALPLDLATPSPSAQSLPCNQQQHRDRFLLFFFGASLAASQSTVKSQKRVGCRALRWKWRRGVGAPSGGVPERVLERMRMRGSARHHPTSAARREEGRDQAEARVRSIRGHEAIAARTSLGIQQQRRLALSMSGGSCTHSLRSCGERSA